MESWDKIFDILKEEEIDVWLIITDGNKDPYYSKFIAPNTSVISIALFTQNDVTIFVSGLEKELVQHYVKGANILLFSSKKNNTLSDLLVDFFLKHPQLKKIALNYTTMNDVNVDTLGYGFYKYYTDLLINKVPYITHNSFVSAETIIYALTDSKNDKDIDKMKIAAQRALDILNLAFKKIKPGMTEIELVQLTHHITEHTRAEFLSNFEGVVIEETYSWEEENCPIVLTGKSFEKGGHALSTNTVIKKGNTVYFDFGVTLTFSDGTSWSSDIQRTGYLLKDEEQDAPKEIKKRFDDIINSITLGIENIKIGMRGYEVDKIVRTYLIEKGYPSYDHATGHAIGELAHNPGTNLTSSEKGTGGLKIQPNGVYTIEPRIALENGVSIEEMVAVRRNGIVETLCSRQNDIILLS